MEFNNREIALGIYLAIIIIIALSKKDIRKSVSDLLKVFFSGKLLIVFGVILIYVIFSLILLAKFEYWDISLLKGTMLWFLFTSLVLISKVNKKSEQDDFLKSIIIANFQIIVLLEFISNLFVFDLLVEMILQPVLFVVAGIIAFSENDNKAREVKVLFEWVLSFLGVLLLVFTVYNIFDNLESVLTIDNLRDILLPPTLTLLFIPFIYLLALYIKYEIYFIRLNHLNQNNPLNFYAKLRILLFFNFRLKKFIRFSRRHTTIDYQTKKDVNNILKNHGISRCSSRTPPYM